VCRKGRALRRRVAEAEARPTLVLANGRGVEVHISPAGAAIQQLLLPDRKGSRADVVLGFDSNGPYVVSSEPAPCSHPGAGMCVAAADLIAAAKMHVAAWAVRC